MANRYGAGYRNGNGSGGPGGPGGYGGMGRAGGDDDDYDPYGDDYGSAAPAPGDRFRQPGGGGRRYDRSPAAPARSAARPPPSTFSTGSGARGAAASETDAERQITRVLEHIRQEWPLMLRNDSVPVQLALQLLDTSSVGRAHDYHKFQKTHEYLQTSLKNIVHEHHQGFNSSIGTFHKIQGSIQASQKRVRALKDSLAAARVSLCSTDPELRKLSAASQAYDGVLQVLNEVEELRLVPDQLEARISEKRFLTAVELLQNALRKMRRPELDEIGALADLRSYLGNQETTIQDILVEELHEHLYLKSPYCQERWQNLARNQGAKYSDSAEVVAFHHILDHVDFEKPVTEDPAKNPESDTFYYIGLLVEALNKLGRLQNAVDTLKQRLPVELFSIVNETINEVDNRHLTSLRGTSSSSTTTQVYGKRETQLRADVIYDLLWTLYGKFEAIGEGHRMFHESIKALIRREGAGNNSALLGSFKELWNLYQNEIRSLLHNYVTTDADVYRFDKSPNPSSGLGKDQAREHLFKLAEADVKSPAMMEEMEALDNIIQAAVPGLTKQGAEKKTNVIGSRSRDQRKSFSDLGAGAQTLEGYKSLVEPSVFNMSLLLPPTLAFLQRLKSIVPPGSDLATSTLTTFLDNFLVNVFQPQLDETLGKLSDSIFGEADSFLQDQNWRIVAKRPVLKGTLAFFDVVTAFCRMLGTIPHDQALSSLILTQMNRYYERCLSWYTSLVSKAQEKATDPQALRVSARMATEPGEVHAVIKELWAAQSADLKLIDREARGLISFANGSRLEMSDVIQDRDIICSLCLLYSSMNWLSIKISGVRHITHQEADSSRHGMSRQPTRRWTLMNDPSKATSDTGPVILPMTRETVKTFDTIVASYEDLAVTALFTLQMEVRCRIVYSLSIALSSQTAPYLLADQPKQPDEQILNLNTELIAFDETVSRYLRDRETAFIRSGLGHLVNSFLVSNASKASPMNHYGCDRMNLNILVLQQNLKNIEQGVALTRALEYYSLFDKGPDAIVQKANEMATMASADDGAVAAAAAPGGGERFSYDELKTLLELCFSEPMSNPERGIATAARRQMTDKMLSLSEHMWQS